ncbi:glycosyltransferase [Rhodobacteraceae bacterium N5(2021)]|uniref:Glycosyltransferase n=1 Tax=Gymnodinialimonas phycosphaerae TaxID=2841589 RepID=A0A975YF79_9RHOB|nr:glycosyltransferase [Gymnodinialimonas phycosphaerae]MBY4894441.1 glycosyltransferase [Gymnodinialimonas phycosphaerae]
MTGDMGAIDQAEATDVAQGPSGNLLTSQADRNNWRAWLAHACDDGGETPQAILARHPRANALQDGFSIGAYLAHNTDVAGAVDTPAEAAFHYLEFGIAEGRNGTPTRWSPDFVAHTLGHSLPPHLTAPQAAAELIARGVPAAEVMLDERDLWLLLGLHGPALADIFHHETYFAALDAAGMDLPAPDRISCIRHFVAVGLDAGIPAHPDHQLDEAFYAATLAELSLDGPATPLHWARIGLRANAHANARAAARAIFHVALPPDITATSGAHLARMLLHPMALVESLDLTNSVLRSFAIDLARARRQRGDIGTAEAVLAHILQIVPDDPRAAVDMAELIHGTRQVTREIALRAVAPPDFDNGENRVMLAKLHLDQGDYDAALTCASTLPVAALGDVAITTKVRALARTIIESLFRKLNKQLTTRPVAEVQDLLTRALALYAPTPDLLERAGPIRRVAILANDDLYQCKLYRADQKADQLRAQGLDVTTFLQSKDVAALRAQLPQFDAVIFQRTPALPDIADVMIDAAKQGLATFFDIDDLIFDAALFPPQLETYAGQITAQTHASLACGVPFFAAAARLCGAGIASTEPIREALAPLTITGTAFTHRNALGLAHHVAMKAAKRPKTDKLVLFYGSGTKAHKAEFSDILEPALARVLKERPGQVEIRLMGEFPDLSHLSPDDVTLMPPVWDFECYMAELSQADIALSVLARSPATDAKSEIKWMEPAMFAIPAVVSASPVMDGVIDNGATGITATDIESFASALLNLIDDEPLRLSIGHAAKAQVLRDYALPAMGAALVQNMQASRPAPKPKLLVVNVFYPPQALGGATRVVADNVSHLREHYGDEFEVDILTTLDGGKTAHEVQAVSHSGTRIWAITNDAAVPDHTMRDPVMDTRFETLLDRIAPDIVHVHCIQRLGAGIVDACRKRSIPYVLTLHDGWWVSSRQFIIDPYGAPCVHDFNAAPLTERVHIARRCITDAAAALAVSEPFAQLHRDAGLPNVQALSNGVSDLPKRLDQPAPDGRVRLGLIGGASRHKGYDILRAALTARAFENIDLIVSDHALPPGAKVHEVWNTTPVLRIPRQPQAQIGALYGRFDVLMAPSVWPESFGLVTREALALGLWVVASDRGAIGADIVEGENGHIVPVDDHRALTQVLSLIDADPARYTQAPSHRATLHTAAAQGDALAALYKDILGRA